MANKVTQEEIELINELYIEMGVKSKVAQAVGRSASTVSRYLIPNYVPKSQRVEIKCEAEPKGCADFLRQVFDINNLEKYEENFRFATQLTEEEKKEIKELRKEIFV